MNECGINLLKPPAGVPRENLQLNSKKKKNTDTLVDIKDYQRRFSVFQTQCEHTLSGLAVGPDPWSITGSTHLQLWRWRHKPVVSKMKANKNSRPSEINDLRNFMKLPKPDLMVFLPGCRHWLRPPVVVTHLLKSVCTGYISSGRKVVQWFAKRWCHTLICIII